MVISGNENISKLLEKKEALEKEGGDSFLIDLILDSKKIMEDTSGTGGPGGAVSSGGVGVGGGGVAYTNASISGMGSIVSAQPSNNVGVTIDPGYTSGGGLIGSGDINVSYNPGGKNVFQKIKVDNRRGTSKRRRNKILGNLKNALSGRQNYVKPEKTMDFETFYKSQLKAGKSSSI